MKRESYNLLSLLFLSVLLNFSPSFCRGQGGGKVQYQEPQTPDFLNVEMDPKKGTTTLYWNVPSKNNTYAQPEGFRILRKRTEATQQVIWEELAVLPASERRYEDNTARGDLASVSYKITAFRVASEKVTGKKWVQDGKGKWVHKEKIYLPKDTIESRPTEEQSTLFLNLDYNSCKDSVTLKWNAYTGWTNTDITYQVMQGETPVWTQLRPGEKVKDVTEVTVRAPQNKSLYYYVEATNEKTKATSKSNLRDILTRQVSSASVMEIDTILSTKHYNQISFKIGKNAKVDHFELYRQDDRDAFVGSLTRKTIWNFTMDDLNKPNAEGFRTGRVKDEGDNENIQAKERFYYIAAFDECKSIIGTSNQPNSIVLKVNNDDRLNKLVWDPLDVRTKEGNKVEYRLYRKLTPDGGEPQTSEFKLVTAGEPLEFVDDVSPLEAAGSRGKRYENKFCYLVKAFELKKNQPNPKNPSLDPEGGPKYWRTRVSISETKCVTLDVRLNMPNAIAPEITGATNGVSRNIFAPNPTVVTDYTMYIYNRAGKLIYTGREWDGKLKNGSFAPEGAYIYRVKLVLPGKAPRTEVGSFMVVYPTAE